MSPCSIAGMYPLYRWRSEPQIPVVVNLIIASRGLRMCGSGTFSTRTFFLPCQHSAFIQILLHMSTKRPCKLPNACQSNHKYTTVNLDDKLVSMDEHVLHFPYKCGGFINEDDRISWHPKLKKNDQVGWKDTRQSSTAVT